jgi:hypothetical protein
MKIAADLKTDLRRSGLDERLLVELAAVRMAELESTVRLEDILRQLDSGGGPGVAATSIRTSEKKKTDAPGRKLSLSKAAPPQAAPPAPTAAPPTDVAQVQSNWPDLVKRLRARNAMLASNLAMAEPRECDGSGIVAAFGPSGAVARQILEKPAHRELLQQCLREHYGTELSIRFMIDSEDKMGTLPGDARDRVRIEPRQLLEKSPRIKMLVEKVDGEILGVRRRK